MDGDDASCLDALKTLAIECVDGDVRASAYVVGANSGAAIVRDSLALDPGHLRLPFRASAVADAMAVMHAPPVEFRSADPPFRLDDVDAMRAAADVLDFLGARAYQEHVIELALPAFKKLPLCLKGKFMNVVFRHSRTSKWAPFVRAALADALFWADFKRDVIDNVDAFDPRIVGRLVEDACSVFAPSWLIAAACNRMYGALDHEGMLEIACAPYPDHTHPMELSDILSAAASTMDASRSGGRAGLLALAALRNARDAADPAFSSPIHGGDCGAAGSLIVFDSETISVFVKMSSLAPGNVARRRTVHKHVSVEVSTTAIAISIDIGSIDGRGEPPNAACRMAVVSGGVPEAEEWFFADGPSRGRRFVFESGRGVVRRGGTPLARAAEFDLSCSLRVDIYYSRESANYFLNLIEKLKS